MWGAWIASWVPLLWLARSLGPAPAGVKRRRSRRPQIEEAGSGAGRGGEALQRRVEAARLGPRLGVVGCLVLAGSLVDDDLGVLHAARAARGGERVGHVADGVHQALLERLRRRVDPPVGQPARGGFGQAPAPGDPGPEPPPPRAGEPMVGRP